MVEVAGRWLWSMDISSDHVSRQPSAISYELITHCYVAPHRAGGTSPTSSWCRSSMHEVLKLDARRHARRVQMALGGLLLVGLFYGSRWPGHPDSDVTGWSGKRLIGYAVFAVIALFQSDIRRRARALRPRAVLPASRADASSAEDTIEELRGRVEPAVVGAHRRDRAAIERQIGLAQLHRGRHPPRRGLVLRPGCRAFSCPTLRCTTAPSSCRRIAWLPPPAFCR